MSDEGAAPVHPPVGLLWAAAVAVLAGAALAAIGGQRANLAGYGLSALVAVGFVAAFPRVDAVRQRNRYYAPRRAPRKIAATLALAALGVAMVNAWPIATRLAS